MKYLMTILILVFLSFNAQAQHVSGSVYFDNRGNVAVQGHYYNHGHRHHHRHRHQHRHYHRYRYRDYHRYNRNFPRPHQGHGPLECSNSWIRSGQQYYRSCHVRTPPRYSTMCYNGYLVTTKVTNYRYDGFYTIRESYNVSHYCR